MSTYEIGAITKILVANTDNTNKVSNIFSDDSRKNFERISKQAEFAPKKTPEILDDVIDKKKKGKKRQREAETSSNDIIPSESSIPPLPSPETELDSGLKDKRTLFVGNVPLSFTLPNLTKMFKEFGEIESVRMRSVPIAGTAVDQVGNQNLVKKVCVNTKKFGDQKGSYNAYIVYKDQICSEMALTANNRVVENRHIRVDKAVPTLFDQKRTLFIGSLSHYTDEEELRTHFAKVLPNGQEDIESVRLVRDPESQLCKGVGYLLLTNRDAVLKALALHQMKFKKRELRVTSCGKRTKRSVRKNNEQESQSQQPCGGGGAVDGTQQQQQQKRKSVGNGNGSGGGGGGGEPSKKKMRKERHEERQNFGAAKRIKNKGNNSNNNSSNNNKVKSSSTSTSSRVKVNPKTFLGKKSKDDRKVPKKKRQLGGAVKKAFKVANANAIQK
eukprot:gene7125-14493_t